MPTDLFVLLSPKTLIFFVVIFTRLSGMVTGAPMLSSYPIPIQIKTWFMASVAFIMFPVIMYKIGFPTPTNIPELALILLKEFIIGYIIGFVANVVFFGVEICSHLISMLMGLTAAQALNPTTGDNSPIFAQAYAILASMIFISINGYAWIFDAIYKSFQIIPPGYSFFINSQFAHNVTLITSQIFSIGFGLAAPIFSVLFMTDVLLGFMAKMMPKMNIFMVALPAKVFLGLFLSLLLVPHYYMQIKLLLGNYLTDIIKVLGG